MIALIEGEVVDRSAESLVVFTSGGVGYELFCSAFGAGAQVAIGQTVRLLTHMVVREDAQLLFGFVEAEEKQLFLQLIGVPSVGPKVALALLSSGSWQEIAAAIGSGDLNRLQKANGVGKRGAERIVTELRDKVVAVAAGVQIEVQVQNQEARDQALAGLIGLGMSINEAETALSFAEGITASELISDALRKVKVAS